jgi:hypothetical protein
MLNRKKVSAGGKNARNSSQYLAEVARIRRDARSKVPLLIIVGELLGPSLSLKVVRQDVLVVE